jgi:hypothetical protein
MVVTGVPAAIVDSRDDDVDGPDRMVAPQFAISGVPATVGETVETSEGCGVAAVTDAVAMMTTMSANDSAKTNRNDRPDARWAPLVERPKTHASSHPEPAKNAGRSPTPAHEGTRGRGGASTRQAEQE